jgi:hypothetical protein
VDKTYTDLRYLFSRANQARTLRLADLANDLRIDVSQSIDRVSEGREVPGIRLDKFKGSAFDDTVEAGQRFTFINSSRTFRAIAANHNMGERRSICSTGGMALGGEVRSKRSRARSTSRCCCSIPQIYSKVTSEWPNSCD